MGVTTTTQEGVTEQSTQRAYSDYLDIEDTVLEALETAANFDMFLGEEGIMDLNRETISVRLKVEHIEEPRSVRSVVRIVVAQACSVE